MSRTFIPVSADDPVGAAEAVFSAGAPPDICVVSPTRNARAAAMTALRGRWIAMVEEPLLAGRTEAESGGDVLARLAQGLRGALALDATMPLVVCDRIDTLGATAFLLDEEGVTRLADDLDQTLSLP